MNSIGFALSSLLITAGICLYAAIHHTILWHMERERRIYLLFVLVCLFGFLFLVTNVGIYQSETPAAYGRLWRYQSTWMAGFLLTLTWFAYKLLKRPTDWFLKCNTVIWGFLMASNLFLKHGYYHYSVVGIRYVTLPWGEQLRYADSLPHPFFFVVSTIAFFSTFMFLVIGGLKSIGSDENKPGKLVAGTGLLWVAAAINDVMIDLQLYDSLYLTDYVFVLTIIGSSTQLAHEWKQLNIRFLKVQQTAMAAEASSRAKSAFLAKMSHELRTPLNAILGFTNLIRRKPGTRADDVEKLDIVHRSGEHLLTLINDVLDLSKIEAGRYHLEEVDFDLKHLLDDLEAMFRLRAETKGLELVFERHHEIPTCIHADNLKLRQVLINLLGNAVKFTEQGIVRCQVVSNDAYDRLDFSIADTGLGISSAELETIFEAFTQSQVGRDAQQGTGLGLAISQQFVRLMGGELTVASEVGKGSTFSFSIPIRIAESEIVPLDTTERTAISLAPDQPLYRMLVVDDDEINRRLLVELLKPFGFELREAVNGAEAVQEFENWNPHLIWMDMRMPVMDGYTAAQEIRSSTRGRAVSIVAVTASTFEEERSQVLAAGCDDFLRKPFREGQIFQILEKLLGIEFIYEEDQSAFEGESKPDSIQIGTLPADLRDNLLVALTEHDPYQIEVIMTEIETEFPEQASWLRPLANEFKYDQLIALIETAES